MSVTVALIAAAHGVPICLAWLLTKSRVVLTIVAGVMAFVAIATGASGYAIPDLFAVALVYYLCYSSAGPSRDSLDSRPAPPEPVRLAPQKASNESTSFMGWIVLIAIGAFFYFKFSADKPAPSAPSLHDRLDASIAVLKKDYTNTTFPLVDARVDGNTLKLSFRSKVQAGDVVRAQYGKTNFIREYSSYYCGSQIFGPLLAEGANISVMLSGNDAKSAGAYHIGKNDCPAPKRSPPVATKQVHVPAWVQVGAEFRGATGYVDKASIRRSGGNVTMIDLMNFRVPRNVPSGQAYLSQRNERTYDCNADRFRTNSFSLHSENMGNGVVVSSETAPQEWTRIVRGKAGEAMWSFVCGRRDSVPTVGRTAGVVEKQSTPTFADLSRCFFVYAPIAQVGRDFPHPGLLQFGQPRVARIGEYVQANRSNSAFKQIFEGNLQVNKEAGIRIEDTLRSALRTQNSAQFLWSLEQATSCDRVIGIQTGDFPEM